MGMRIDDPGHVAEAWQRALASDRPVVIDAFTDPEVSPYPEHVLLRKTDLLALSVSKGDKGAFEHTGHIVTSKIQEKLDDKSGTDSRSP